MSEGWIQVSKRLLDRIKRLEETEERDRLELVRSTCLMLDALQISLLGWMQWVNNPNIMTKFTKEDLEEINKKMSKFIRSFIEYDLEATKLGSEKGLKAAKKVKKKKERNERFYV